MKQITLDTKKRAKTGKGAVRKLRSSGMLPGILYGRKTEPVPLSVDNLNFNKALYSAKGERILFTLQIKDNGESQERTAIVKDLQRHPVNEAIRHVDFYEVFMDKEIKITVPITPVGKAKGVELDNGILDIVQRQIEVSCFPGNMPDEIRVDVTELGLGDALHASDVVLPENVSLLENPETTLVTITGSGYETIEEISEEELEAEEAEKAEETEKEGETA